VRYLRRPVARQGTALNTQGLLPDLAMPAGFLASWGYDQFKRNRHLYAMNQCVKSLPRVNLAGACKAVFPIKANLNPKRLL
jgi:hypothetical protein